MPAGEVLERLETTAADTSRIRSGLRSCRTSTPRAVTGGDPTDAAIITAIVVLSVGLGFVNEYRSERAVAALHANIRHEALVTRDGVERRVDTDVRCSAQGPSARSFRGRVFGNVTRGPPELTTIPVWIRRRGSG